MARFATDNDFAFVKKSWAECFEDSPEFVDWNFSFNYKPSDTVIAEYNGVPASVMQLIPYTLRICGTSFRVRYISGVSTMPVYRGKGLVRELFDFGLPAMYDMGCDISLLIPAVDGMYEKFGYRSVCQRTLYDLVSAEYCTMHKSADSSLIRQIKELYSKSMQARAHIDRTDRDWDKIITDLFELSHGCVFTNDTNGTVVGYAIAYPKGDSYELWEICGDIHIDATPVSAPPVMARIINPKAVFSALNVPIPEDSDNEALTELLFDILSAENPSYINLLL